MHSEQASRVPRVSRQRQVVREKIQKEFEALSVAALKARSQAVSPLPPLPRVPQSKKVDGMRLLILSTRVMGLCPVYRERASTRVPLTPTAPTSSPGSPSPVDNSLPLYRPSIGWAIYSCFVFIILLLLNIYLVVAVLADMRDPDIATGLISVMSAVAFAMSGVNSLAMVAGAKRKYRLLPRLLNWPVSRDATAHPTTRSLLLHLGPLIALYATTDYSYLYQQPIAWVLLLAVFAGVMERFNLTFLAGRAYRCFASVNEELRQLGALFRDRMRLQYVPDAAAKIVQLRAQHERVADYLELANKAYELQIVGILLYDFGTTILTIYQFIIYVSSNNPDPYDIQMASVLLFNAFYSAVATTCLCRACYWTQRQGRKTHSLVHKALSCITISKEECLELTIFSMQLMHQSFNVSPLGILFLDNSLLASMSLGVVMYVLVLYQLGASRSSAVPIAATTPPALNTTWPP